MAKNFTLIHGNSKFQPFCEFYLMLKVTDVTLNDGRNQFFEMKKFDFKCGQK